MKIQCLQAQKVPGWDPESPKKEYVILVLVTKLPMHCNGKIQDYHLAEGGWGGPAGQGGRGQAFAPLANTVILQVLNSN